MGNVVAVIPARANSKGLPRKNILPLIGKPVLTYTLNAALQARSLNRVILSTDSEEIAEIGTQAGIEVPFIRPSELATDNAHPSAVLEHAISFLSDTEGYETSLVVTLQPTSPLRVSRDIDEAVDLLQNNPQMDSVISIVGVDLPPYWILRAEGQYLKPFVDDGTDYSLRRRQELEQTYRPNGAVYVTRRELLKTQGLIFSAFSQGKTGYIIMDPIRSLDIDTETDFRVIEALLERTQTSDHEQT